MTVEKKINQNKSQALNSPEGLEFTNSFQIGLFTTMETYTLTPEVIQLLEHLGSWNTLTEINQQSLEQVSRCVWQNVQTIHRWLAQLIEARSTLLYTDTEGSTPSIRITNKDYGDITLQYDALELEFPDGRRMCDASRIISCLYLLGRLDEPNREYEPFELKDAADLILANGNQLAEYISEQARLGRSMAVVNQQEPDDHENYHYFEEEYDYDAPAYFRADPRMRNEISYC